MATCAAPTRVIAGIPSLKSATKASIRSQDEGGLSRVFFNKTKYARGAARTTCADASIIISLSTGASLFLGRFVFLPIQREQIAKAGLPQQNGVTHFEAGDTRAQEVSSLLQTNDPAGFTIVDVLAWGSIGHIVAYFILATASNGYEPQF